MSVTQTKLIFMIWAALWVNLFLTFAKKKAHMSLVVRKPAFCICEYQDADQLRGNRQADQPLCFRYTDSTIPFATLSDTVVQSLYFLNSKFQAFSHLLWLYSLVCVGPGRKPYLRTRHIWTAHANQQFCC